MLICNREEVCNVLMVILRTNLVRIVKFLSWCMVKNVSFKWLESLQFVVAMCPGIILIEPKRKVMDCKTPFTIHGKRKRRRKHTFDWFVLEISTCIFQRITRVRFMSFVRFLWLRLCSNDLPDFCRRLWYWQDKLWQIHLLQPNSLTIAFFLNFKIGGNLMSLLIHFILIAYVIRWSYSNVLFPLSSKLRKEKNKIYIPTYLWNIGWNQTMLFLQTWYLSLKSLAKRVDSVRSTVTTFISWVHKPSCKPWFLSQPTQLFESQPQLIRLCW